MSAFDQRKIQLANWAAMQLNTSHANLQSVAGDASFRRYFRFQHNNASIIAVDAPPEHENNQAFCQVAELLSKFQLSIPTILHRDYQQGFLLISDLGDALYLDQLTPHSVDSLYNDAFNAILSMLKIPAQQMQMLPLFDSEALRTEMELFREWFISRFLNISLTQSENKLVEEVFDRLIKNALNQPQHFVHRDFHSRNLMIPTNPEIPKPGIIDFQDAVVGPISYDLVSLLKDCYIKWPAEQVDKWCAQFHQQLQQLDLYTAEFTTFIKHFDLMGMQRHIKVLGIFCRLNERDNKPGYLKDLPLTFDYLVEAMAKYSEFEQFQAFLQDRVQPVLTIKMAI